VRQKEHKQAWSVDLITSRNRLIDLTEQRPSITGDSFLKGVSFWPEPLIRVAEIFTNPAIKGPDTYTK
jgi:hypothetical protein